MKQTLKWTGLILFAATVGLALVVLVSAGVRTQSSITFARSAAVQETPSPYNGPLGYGPGMMGGWSSSWLDNDPTPVYTPTRSLPYSGYGPGMMGPYGYGPMGGMMRAMGDFGAWRGTYPVSGTPLTIDQAIEAAHRYLSSYGNPDLALTEVMEFSNNFYAEVEEESTGVHAFELLIDRYSGAVYPEPGPNMMWNTKYGHMSGMMGGGWGQAPATVSVTSEQAQDLAQKWLDQYLPGTAAAEQADAFYGYYTIHVLKDGQVSGMLSVNDYTGQVWYHTWHGDFVGMKELEE